LGRASILLEQFSLYIVGCCSNRMISVGNYCTAIAVGHGEHANACNIKHSGIDNLKKMK
jgi:hypothetical protein